MISMRNPEEKTLAPRIRFSGFNDAWEQRRLGDVTEVFDGTHQTPTYTDGGVMFVSVEDIATLRSDKYISRDAFEKDFKVHPEKGDTLMTRIGDIGTANVVNSDDDLAFYVSLALLKPREIDSIYLVYCLSSPFARNELYKRTLHIAFPKKINKNEIEKSLIPYPISNAEQRKIGALFSRLDNLIALHQRKCDGLKMVKKSLLEKMFPREGETTPELRFSGFTDAWEQRRISDLFKITRGHVLATDETCEQQTKETPFPVFSSQTKNEGLMGYYKEYLYQDAITWTTDGANAGTVNFRPGRFYCTNVCGVLLSGSVKADKMIAEALGMIAKSYVSYVGNPKLMNNVVAEITISIPHEVEERQKVSALIKTLDNLIALHQRKLDRNCSVSPS